MDLLEVKNLHTWFRTRKGPVHAVDGVTFSIPEGSAIALVGESGCGKSVTALSLAKLIPEPPGFYPKGEILYCGKNVLHMNSSEIQQLRGKEIAFVFQDPANALNPVLTIGKQIQEGVCLHRSRIDSRREVLDMMDLVGIPNPFEIMKAYPHQLCGGMKQRALIAIALACRPRLLVADEPTTALDVTIQAQLIESLSRLRSELGMALLLITHNLGIVAQIVDTVNVMYAGRIIESGPVDKVLTNCAHPYTRGLVDAVPRMCSIQHDSDDVLENSLKGIPGTVPHPDRLPSGCKFSDRCSYVQKICRKEEPVDHVVDATDEHNVQVRHMVRCWLPKSVEGNS